VVSPVPIPLLLSALYPMRFRFKPAEDEAHQALAKEPALRAAMAAE